ncbi:MAG: helix-turn-helix domain-containing protein [Clostridia bacterium]|nr:helix-turn-helix domain-containing protein [Clostridia bacterium]
MENFNVTLGENIRRMRKEKNLTQEELASRLGLTYQAVSKWEHAKSSPDITLLPVLADLFNCSIDALFSRGDNTVPYNTVCTELPWKDDGIIRGVVCLGRKILRKTDDLVDRFTFEVIGDAKSVKSECNVSIRGHVNGGCNAGRSITIDGNVTGGLNCGANASVGGNHIGGLNCGSSVSCNGNIEGGINCGSSISCKNLKASRINCGSTISADGNIQVDLLNMKNGKITCGKLDCGTIKGKVTIKTNE